jgi:hypothetical protein
LNSFPIFSQEIVRYVRTGKPGIEGSSPRYSLYLSAMLTHGAIIGHHKQVTLVSLFTLKFAVMVNMLPSLVIIPQLIA